MERQGQVRDEAEGEGADGAQGGRGGGEGDGEGEQLTEGAAQRHLRQDGGMVARSSGGCEELSRREGVWRIGTSMESGVAVHMGSYGPGPEASTSSSSSARPPRRLAGVCGCGCPTCHQTQPASTDRSVCDA